MPSDTGYKHGADVLVSLKKQKNPPQFMYAELQNLTGSHMGVYCCTYIIMSINNLVVSGYISTQSPVFCLSEVTVYFE